MRTLPILTITLVLISICSFSCDKKEKEPELPPITQSGANTFGCLVNGEVWLPKKGMITTPPYGVSNNGYTDKRWIIIANNSYQTVNITMCKDSVIKGSSTFNIESIDNCSSARFNDSSANNKQYYFTDGNVYNGQILISSFDVEKQIIAGTFYFDAVSDNGEVVKIRDGRFDLKFTNYQP